MLGSLGIRATTPKGCCSLLCIHWRSCNRQTKGFSLFHPISYLCEVTMLRREGCAVRRRGHSHRLSFWLFCLISTCSVTGQQTGSVLKILLPCGLSTWLPWTFFMHSGLWMVNFQVKRLLSSEVTLKIPQYIQLLKSLDWRSQRTQRRSTGIQIYSSLGGVEIAFDHLT